MAYTDYSSLFSGAEQKYGLPPGTLSGVGYVESRYNPQAVSPKGAQGLMQFMPSTAKNLGLSNPFDPAASIDAAGNLLSQNLKATGGDLPKALMMYNAGSNPAKWQPSYAQAVLSHVQPQSNPYTAPSGDQQPMPPLPPARPLTSPNQGQNASLGALANQPVPVDTGAQVPGMLPGPPSLGALAASPSLPQGNIPQPSHSKFNAGNILGVLGDSLMAYSGLKPSFGPFLQEQKVLGQQQNFEREKFQQELAMRMYAMTHPEDWMKAQMFSQLPPDQQYNIGHYEDVTNPVNVSTPQGTQNVPRTATRTVDGKTYYKIGNDWYQAGGQ